VELSLLALFASYSYAVVLLYAGPDQLLPLASLLGTIVGILLIGWQRIVGLMRRSFSLIVQKFRGR